MRDELFRINLCDFWNEERWYFVIWKFGKVVGIVFLGVCGIRRRRVSVVLISVDWSSSGGGMVDLVLLLEKFCFW